MIVVTGAAGFIASNLARALIDKGFSNLLLVDLFGASRSVNMAGLKHLQQMDRDVFPEWFTEHADEVDFIFHLGARTDTSEFNFRILDSLNLSYSKTLWEICTIKQIPIVYASSAATYGAGELGFDDNESAMPQLKPLNPYGLSKQLFDMHVLQSKDKPPFWAGLKFFNVYGPHESYKGRMASVIYHAYHQIKENGKLKLFQSHLPEYKDGEQLRDFIYVQDIVNICLWFFENKKATGIYNAGTGQARTFNDLAAAVFSCMQIKPAIDYMPIPEDIRDKYQYFTQAKTDKLLAAGYNYPFTSLEEGIAQYITYLQKLL